MNTYAHADHSKGNPRFARRTGGVKAKPDARLECFATAQIGLSALGNVTIPPPAQKSFDAEGEALEHALTKSFRLRNDAIKSLCSSVRRFRDATIQGRMQKHYPHGSSPSEKSMDSLPSVLPKKS
jgi:hypothetical protein